MTEIKKSASIGDYVIKVNEDNSVTVFRDGTPCANTKAAMREASELAGFIPNEGWNTRQFGCRLVKALNKSENNNDRISKGNNDFQGNSENLKIVHEKDSSEGKDYLVELCNLLTEKDVDDAGFSSNKDSIEKIFANTSSDKRNDILTRLTIIDSMYSTQMGKRYYGLDELADVISYFENLKTLACDFSNDVDASIFSCEVKPSGLLGGFKSSKRVSLFDEKYGINKNGEDAGVAISLISKYLYFLTGYKFPIYDSIALEMFPKLWIYCGFPKEEMPAYKSKLSSSDANYGNNTIECFVSAINVFVQRLGIDSNPRKYDILDRIMWFTGKICRGNLSLILTQEEYILLAENQKEKKNTDKFEFDIADVELSELSFLEENGVRREFFKLAKKLYEIK